MYILVQPCIARKFQKSVFLGAENVDWLHGVRTGCHIFDGSRLHLRLLPPSGNCQSFSSGLKQSHDASIKEQPLPCALNIPGAYGGCCSTCSLIMMLRCDGLMLDCGCCSHGTTGYRAPEQVLQNTSCQQSDIYAAGMMAASMLEPLFQNYLDRAVVQHGGGIAFYSSPDSARGVLPTGLEALIEQHLVPQSLEDPEMIDVIRECLRPLPHQRPSASQLREWLVVEYGLPHPWALPA